MHEQKHSVQVLQLMLQSGSSDVGGVDRNIICWGFYDAPDRLRFLFGPKKHFWQIHTSEAVVCRV